MLIQSDKLSKDQKTATQGLLDLIEPEFWGGEKDPSKINEIKMYDKFMQKSFTRKDLIIHFVANSTRDVVKYNISTTGGGGVSCTCSQGDDYCWFTKCTIACSSGRSEDGCGFLWDHLVMEVVTPMVQIFRKI